MSALITSIEKIKRASTERGFRLFCAEHDIDPDNFVEPEEGVMIDSLDLLRYGMDRDYADLKADVAEITSGFPF